MKTIPSMAAEATPSEKDVRNRPSTLDGRVDADQDAQGGRRREGAQPSPVLACHNFAAHESARIRPFTVEAFVGHRVTGWPFARFDISISELRVRLSFPL